MTVRWLLRAARRRRPAVGTALLVELFVALALLAVFAPLVGSLTSTLTETRREASDAATSQVPTDLIDAALADFAQNIAVLPKCENPADAANSKECVTFAEPSPAPSPLFSFNAEVDQIQVGASLGGRDFAGLSREPMCFVAQVPGPPGDVSSWWLKCLFWVLPNPMELIRTDLTADDRTGWLVFTDYPATPGSTRPPERPDFDPMGGVRRDHFQVPAPVGAERSQVRIGGFSAFRMFWRDGSGFVDTSDDTWKHRRVCYDRLGGGTYGDECAIWPPGRAVGRVPYSVDAASYEDRGLRRIVIYLCAPNSPGLPPDPPDVPVLTSVCVHHLNDDSLTDPTMLEAALYEAGVMPFVHRFELVL